MYSYFVLLPLLLFQSVYWAYYISNSYLHYESLHLYKGQDIFMHFSHLFTNTIAKIFDIFACLLF